jgi:hypothetical protein
MDDKGFHFEVEGPRRDYDRTTFCCKAFDEAVDFATEWMAELADGQDVGESDSVTFRTVAGPCERCYGTGHAIDRRLCAALKEVSDG